MATITRGKTFGATEQVTNTKLHQLVDNATITGITSDDISGGSGQLVIIQGSAPSSPSAGWLWYDTTNGVLRLYNGADWIPVAHGHIFTNKSGSSVAAGDVVIFDSANANSIKTTTTANSSDAYGVVIVGGADNTSVIVITEGYVPTVNVTGATSIGDFLFTSTTAGKADPSPTFGKGAFARAHTSGSTTVSATISSGLSANVAGAKFSAINATSAQSRSLSAGSGTQNIAHGLGTSPSEIRCIFSYDQITGASLTGFCLVNGGTFAQGCHRMNNGTASNDKAGVFSGKIMRIENSSGANVYHAEVTAVDSTNITLTWTLTGSFGAGTIDFIFVSSA